MAVSGIRLQSVAQFVPKSGTQKRTQRLANAASDPALRLNSDNASQNNAAVINSQNPQQIVKSALFTPVPATTRNLKSTNSSRATDQTNNRNTVQRDSSRASNPTGKALQLFQDVADFERKDALTNLVGIDLYI